MFVTKRQIEMLCKQNTFNCIKNDLEQFGKEKLGKKLFSLTLHLSFSWVKPFYWAKGMFFTSKKAHKNFFSFESNKHVYRYMWMAD